MTAVVPGTGSSVLASDIITASMRALGFLGFTEVAKAGEATFGLETLNRMLDSWAGEGLASWAVSQQLFILTTGKQQYTIGTVGTPDINNTRPTDISSAFIRDTNNLDYPMKVLNQDQWNLIGNKGITSQIPNSIFYDSQFPLGIINIFPVPLLQYSLYYDSILQQMGFALLTTQLSTPPGYVRAYIMNLACEMMSAGFPCMLKAEGLARLYENASDAKANIKRINIKLVEAEYDPYIVSNSYASYNVFSDSFARR